MQAPEADTRQANVAAARRYLEALSNGVHGDDLIPYFTEDLVQEEFPNRLVPNGARRDLAAVIEGSIRGRKVMSSQSFEILRIDAIDAERVALEALWSGTLAVDLGTLGAGDAMRARFAVFLEFRDGRICAQRNYDCFDPW